MTASGTTATQEFLRDELKIQSRLTRSKLTADVKCAINLEERTQEDRAHQRELESHRAARQNYSPTVELTTSNREEAEGSPAARDHHGSRVRVHFAPKLPSYDPSTDQSSGADTFQILGKSLGGWVEGHDTDLAEAVARVMDRVDRHELEGMIQDLPEQAIQLDTSLGAHLFSTADQAAQTELYEDDSRKF